MLQQQLFTLIFRISINSCFVVCIKEFKLLCENVNMLNSANTFGVYRPHSFVNSLEQSKDQFLHHGREFPVVLNPLKDRHLSQLIRLRMQLLFHHSQDMVLLMSCHHLQHFSGDQFQSQHSLEMHQEKQVSLLFLSLFMTIMTTTVGCFAVFKNLHHISSLLP